MLNRSAKQAFFALAGPLMKVSGFLYRRLMAPRKGIVKVQLGPGQSRYIEGWINVDANAFTGKCEVWADLRNPLPFHDETVDAMYSHHVVEHLPDLDAHFREVFRCLKPGGVYRVGGPNGDSAIRKFVEDDKNWFGNWPDRRSSIGGRFENFVFCRREHLTILTFSFLEEIMKETGFSDIRICCPARETKYPELFGECMSKEHESDLVTPHTLIVEGTRPQSCRCDD